MDSSVLVSISLIKLDGKRKRIYKGNGNYDYPVDYISIHELLLQQSCICVKTSEIRLNYINIKGFIIEIQISRSLNDSINLEMMKTILTTIKNQEIICDENNEDTLEYKISEFLQFDIVKYFFRMKNFELLMN